MKETEIKILNIDKQKITKALEALGAHCEPPKKVIAKSFDFKDDRISKNHCLLRLREI